MAVSNQIKSFAPSPPCPPRIPDACLTGTASTVYCYIPINTLPCWVRALSSPNDFMLPATRPVTTLTRLSAAQCSGAAVPPWQPEDRTTNTKSFDRFLEQPYALHPLSIARCPPYSASTRR